MDPLLTTLVGIKLYVLPGNCSVASCYWGQPNSRVATLQFTVHCLRSQWVTLEVRFLYSLHCDSFINAGTLINADKSDFRD